jgi:glyoxylase-like metal-dependent hydrolase (beta-lactamase superfamily II)
MKTFIYGFLLTGIVLLLSVSINAQTNTSWFTINEVSEKVWVLSDHNIDNIYLIEGKDSALLIDTGIGAADLVSAVKKLTDKPLIVIITHGHPDHCGSNWQFEKVYIHPADSAAAHMLNLPETRANMTANMMGNATLSPEEIYSGPIYNTRLLPLEEGQIFNLGGRFIKVMETPGHTPGEICLLDIGNKLLFTGDNNNSLVWLFLEGSSPLSKYLLTLEKQKERIGEFDIIFPGHGPQMASDFILDQIACVKAILDGTCEVKDYKSFAGDSRICTYGRASVAFNPENL